MLPCVCSVIDQRWRQNVVKKKNLHNWAAGECVADGFYRLTARRFVFLSLGIF